MHHRYAKPREFSIVDVPLPEVRDEDVLVKVKACGVCGTGKFGVLEAVLLTPN